MPVIKRLITIFCLSFALKGYAQTANSSYVGEWKSYMVDSITFEYLKLNPDGTGLKCFGKTLNGKDYFYEDQITALIITKWWVTGNRLILQNKNKLSFDIDNEYQLGQSANGGIALLGEHLRLGVYPSFLNRKENYREVSYQRSEKLKGYGATVLPCVLSSRPFSYAPVDNSTQLATYAGFADLVPHLLGCSSEYEFAKRYYDPSYTIKLPASLKKLSIGYGTRNFYYSLNTEESDKDETSIVIYYDFADEMKDRFFSRNKKENKNPEIVTVNGRNVYLGKNWQNKFEGKIFLENHLVIAYYTFNSKLENQLRDCIASFKYR